MGADYETAAAGHDVAGRALKGEPSSRSKGTGWAARIILIAGSVLFSLAVLEVGCRLMRSGPEALVHWPNLARERMGTTEGVGKSCAYAYDDELGWTSPPDCTSPGYNFDAEGFRRMPGIPAVAGPPILATGASFTLGQEVADDESWPAYLQNQIGRRVLNAGVSGYSLDQTVLRTERLAARTKPLLIVLSFTPGDIRRSELRVAWSREKPYFAVADGRLELRNVPVPGQPDASVPLPAVARLLGWSVLADEIVKRLGVQKGWYFDEVQAVPSGTGETIACLLMTRLAAIGTPVVVMAQYGRGHWMADAEGKAKDRRAIAKVLACASDAGLMPFDLWEPLKRAVDASGIDALFATDHNSAKGNRVVADAVEQELVRRHFLTLTADR